MPWSTAGPNAVAAARDLLAGPGRRLLGLTGPPGAGTSTLAEGIVAALGPAAVVVPMDGFHLSNDRLRQLGLADRKGAPETFDRAGYVDLLARLRDPSVEMRAPLDVVWYVAVADESRGVALLVARHESFGRPPAAAREWVLRSDEANARLVESGRPAADRVVVAW